MGQTTEEFVLDMICDSHGLERANEPGQAFDKLARGIEAFADRSDPGHGHARKIRDLIAELFTNDAVWSGVIVSERQIRHFVAEFSFYVAKGEADSARSLKCHAESLSAAIRAGDRQSGAYAFAGLFLMIRNNRFHGNPEFSGHNFRVARAAPAFLAVLRAMLLSKVGHP